MVGCEVEPGLAVAPGPVAVAVWFVRPAPVGDEPLDDAERGRAARFRRPDDRQHYVAAHTALRLLAGRHVGEAPRDLRMDAWPCPLCGEPHGRPRLADHHDAHLSLSHTDGLIAIALAGAAVGVDVESLTRAVTAEDLAVTRHAAEPEPPDRDAALRGWVRKESYLKALGTGLGLDPATVDLSAPIPGWHLADLDVPAGHVGAVTVATADAVTVRSAAFDLTTRR